MCLYCRLMLIWSKNRVKRPEIKMPYLYKSA